MVGKWHLGFFEWPYTPTYRGYDSFYGFYSGAEDHFQHDRMGVVDLHDNKEPVRDMGGVYSARLFAKVRWSSFKGLKKKRVSFMKCFESREEIFLGKRHEHQ